MDIKKLVAVKLTEIEGMDEALKKSIKDFFAPIEEVGDPVTVDDIFDDFFRLYLDNVARLIDTVPAFNDATIDEVLVLMPEINSSMFEAIVGNKALSVLMYREFKELAAKNLQACKDALDRNPLILIFDDQYSGIRTNWEIIAAKCVS